MASALLALHATDVVVIYGESMTLKYVSPSVRSLFGWEQHDLTGRSLFYLVHDEDAERVVDGCWSAMHDGDSAKSLQFRLRLAGGSHRWVELRRQCIPVSEEDQKFAIGTITDVQEQHDLVDSLRALASTDELTGLMSRVAILEALRTTVGLSASSGRPMGLLLVDLDNLKRVNDSYGHLGGDAVLRGLGRALVRALRRFDMVGRYGGDEFVVVLPGCGAGDIRRVAGGVLEAVSNQRVAVLGKEGEVSLQVTASIGGTVLAGPVEPNELILQADNALYVSKRSGRNRVTIA